MRMPWWRRFCNSLGSFDWIMSRSARTVPSLEMRAGPPVHRQIAVDAVAGAVVEIEAVLAANDARARLSSWAPLVPSGNIALAMAI